MSYFIVGLVCIVVGLIGGIFVAKPAQAEFDALHNRLTEFEAKVSNAIASLKK